MKRTVYLTATAKVRKLFNKDPPDDEKDQDYIINLENQLSQTPEERQKAKEEADNNLNKLRYLMADFDNYRKRMERQVESKITREKQKLL